MHPWCPWRQSQVDSEGAREMVQQLSDKEMATGLEGWEGVEHAWAAIDVGTQAASGGSAQVSRGGVRSAATASQVSASAMRATLQEEVGDCDTIKNYPLTSFEVARVVVGLFHFGWRQGQVDRYFWARLAYCFEELGQPNPGCSWLFSR